MKLPAPRETRVPSLGGPSRPSPFPGTFEPRGRVLVSSALADLTPYLASGDPPPTFEKAGPRETIHFDPAGLGCGIVTCGGLCPGLNDVIRAIVMTLRYGYGVRRIRGFRYGYAGLSANPIEPPIDLTPERVKDIQHLGGTILGSSRGPQEPSDMVDALERHRISALFCIGGDGTLRGASALAREVDRRGADIAIIGIPKTIDNDLLWTWRTFGYDTAVEEASRVLRIAHNEARGAPNGVGLVKLMGRHSGFIAAEATLACTDVNFCLVPEVPFGLHGPGAFLESLEARLARTNHAVVAVAEGAGQELLAADEETRRDASGNRKLGDIGVHLRDTIRRHFDERGHSVNVRYIDPSYTIRGCAANALDSTLCLLLGQEAVHAAMAGRTDVVIGYWNQEFVLVPIALATAGRRAIDPDGPIWQRVLDATGQPRSLAVAG